MEWKKLLVTTDLSEASLCALEAAAGLARRFGGPGTLLTLLTVIDFESVLPPGAIALSPDKEQAFKQDVRAKVRARLSELSASHFAGLKVELAIEEGSGAARAICDYAERNPPDLLVIATHGRSGLTRALIGSVAERVVRMAPCPVLSLHPTTAA